jgi:large subunit ribosomal protein L3
MPKTKNPRRGSLAYWPRKRAKKQVPRVRSMVIPKDTRLSGFPGYKVGVTTVEYVDNRKTAPTKNEVVAKPATVVECPPLKVYSVRYYKNTPYGLKLVTEVVNNKVDKDLSRKVTTSKKSKQLKDDQEFDVLRLVVYTKPSLTSIGKKKPDIFELTLGGSKEEQVKYAKEHTEKEINVKDVFAEGQLLDVHSVSKGKGYQGTVRRYGISLRSHKSEKSRRQAILGAEGDEKVTYLAHQPGNLGFALRTEYNKWLIKIVDDISKFNHFKHYGNVRNSCMLVKGTIPGASKRMVLFTGAKRPSKKFPTQAPEIRNIK